MAGNNIGTFTKNTTTYIAGSQNDGYMDIVVNCNNSFNCNVGLGNTATGMQTQIGFVLVEEATQDSAHNWIYLPVQWDSGNTRTYIGTPVSDDVNYKDIALTGSTSDYKGLTTYGTLVSHSTTTGGGSATLNYPDSFMYGNVYVLGPNGVITSGTSTSTVTTQTYHPVLSDVVKLDSEITDSDKQNSDLVLVGGPCVNTLVTALYTAGKFQYNCENWALEHGAGRIQVIPNAFANGKTVVVIVGTDAVDTDLVAQIVQRGLPEATLTQQSQSILDVTGTVNSPVYT